MSSPVHDIVPLTNDTQIANCDQLSRRWLHWSDPQFRELCPIELFRPLNPSTRKNIRPIPVENRAHRGVKLFKRHVRQNPDSSLKRVRCCWAGNRWEYRNECLHTVLDWFDSTITSFGKIILLPIPVFRISTKARSSTLLPLNLQLHVIQCKSHHYHCLVSI